MSCKECGSPFPLSHFGNCKVATGMKSPVGQVEDFGEVGDGFGTTWNKCKADCQMYVVRPGLADCDCEKGWPKPQHQIDFVPLPPRVDVCSECNCGFGDHWPACSKFIN